MVRIVLRVFAGLFGIVNAAVASSLAIDRQWPPAVMGGIFAFLALRYALRSNHRASAAGSRRPQRRDAPSQFEFLDDAAPAKGRRKPPAPLVNNEWPAKGDFGCDVVGESNYQPALIAAVGAPPTQWQEVMVTAELVCERSNRHDPKAVAVMVNGQHVGYLSRSGARSFHARLERRGIAGQTTRCGAMIRGGGTAHDGTQRMYGIWLDIQPFA